MFARPGRCAKVASNSEVARTRPSAVRYKLKAWFYPALAAAVRPGDPEAAAAFVRHLDSPRRVVLEIVPEGRIGFDSTQM